MAPDPSGINWDDEVPAQAPPADDGIAWDDETQAGPPLADFSNVQAGVQKGPGTLAQLTSRAGNALRAGADTTALAEAATNLLTGSVAPVAGGVAGLGTLAMGGTLDEAVENVSTVSDAATFHPETEHGKAVTGAVMYPLEKLVEGAHYAGEKTLEKTGSPIAATAVDTLIQGLPLAAGFRFRGSAAKGAAMGEEIVAGAVESTPPKPSMPEAVRNEPVPPTAPPAAAAVAGPELPARGSVSPEVAGMAEPAPARAAQPEAPAPAPVELPPLYHGTKRGFADFEAGTEGAASDPGVFGAGHYATSDPRLASVFSGKGEGANVRQVAADLKNPKVFDSPQEAIEWQGERGTDSPEAAARVRAKYEEAGHDGVVVRNNQGKVQEVVAFKPEAFRSPLENPPREATPVVDREAAPASDNTPAPDLTHLNALELGRSHEAARLAQAKTPGERAAREVYLAQIDKEIAGEKKFLGIDKEPERAAGPEMTDDQLLAELSDGVDPAADFTDVHRGELGRLPGEVGWAERGGRMIRDRQDTGAGGEVVGRTQWVPKSDFWPRYRANDPNPLTEAQAREAFRKFDAGEPLGKREQRFMAEAHRSAAARAAEYMDESRLHEETARVEDLEGTRASIRPAEVEGAEPIAGRGSEVPPAVRKPGDVEASAAEAPEPTTGIYNAKVAEERARRGLEEVKHNLSRTDPESWGRVQEKVDADPTYAHGVAQDFAKRPRPASKEEAIAIIMDRQRIKNERRAAYDDAELSLDAGDMERAAQARQRIEDLDAQMEVNDTAARVTGHEWAEAGRARQLLSRDDYSMAEMVRRNKVRKGADLEPAEMKATETLAKKIEDLETRLAKAEEAARSKEVRARTRNPIAQKDAVKRFDALVDQLKKMSDKEQMLPGCVV